MTAPDEAVDTTLDRVVDKIDEGIKIEDATKYSFGVAHFVFLESLRANNKRQLADHTFYENGVLNNNGNSEGEIDGFVFSRECFNALSEEDQTILTRYFADLKSHELKVHRQNIADELGVTLNQLRLRIYRLRNRLTDCLEDKLKK